MVKEHQIQNYFKPTGLRARNVLTYDEKLELLKKNLKNKEDTIITIENETNKTESCIDKKDLMIKNENKLKEFRKSSLIRARKLVDSAIINVSKYKDDKREIAIKNIKNKLAVRKRLFDETLEKEDTKLEAKYKILKNKLPKIPAFKRFKHLIDPDLKKEELITEKVYPYETNFPLPSMYEKLFQFYKSADSVLFIMYQRKEPCSFLKLKKMVEALTHKSFEKSDFAKLYNLRPNDFNVFLNETPNGISKLENDGNNKPMLMIIPDYKEALEKLCISVSPITNRYDDENLKLSPIKRIFKQNNKNISIYSPSLRSPIKCEDVFKSPKKLKEQNDFVSPRKSLELNVVSKVRPSHLTWRRDQMRLILLKKTHDQHLKFLQKLNIMKEIDYSKIKQWHSNFDLDNVELISDAVLPDDNKLTCVFTAKDILENTTLKLNNTITKIMKNVVNEQELAKQVDNTNNDSELNPSVSLNLSNELSEVSSLNLVCQKVLNKISPKMIDRV